MKKILAFSIVLFAFTAGVFAQATATATAVIVAPISIARDADMSFGNIIADADGGTVVLVPAGTRTLNGLTSPSIVGTITAASFTVTGLIDATYAITLPASHTISSGGNDMIVDTFTSTPSGTGTLTGGTETLDVGATLNVGLNQPAGTYTNAAGFTVTVNYN
ncbi:MAG: DUF4402 domain-containing protein [Bacteroidales bacterium]|nr:DUF4402 domain-containing protein [Bacteroidales bacterium]